MILRPKLHKLAFLKVVNSEKHFFWGFVPNDPTVEVIEKTEKVVDIP